VGGISFLGHRMCNVVKGSLFPASVFGLSCILFFALNPFNHNILLTFHLLFFVLLASCLCMLFYFDRARPLFFILATMFSYLLINGLKKSYGSIYWSTAQYCYLAVIIPINLMMFYHLPQCRLRTSKNLHILLYLLAEFTVFELLSKYDVNLLTAPSVFGLNNISFFVFAACLLLCFFSLNSERNTRQTYLFFAILCIFCGFLFSAYLSAVCLFFMSSMIIITVQIALEIYNSVSFDDSTGVFTPNMFFKHEKRFFPLKYSVALTHIDNYDNLLKACGRSKTSKLVTMIINEIVNFPDIFGIYRIDEDDFLLVFLQKDRTSTINIMEDIRRNIASREFILKKSQKPVKVTISCAVAEKKRSDAGAASVVMRVLSAFDKGYKLAQNIVLKA